MYLTSDLNNKPDSTVREAQCMLNAIRINYHHNWEYLSVDGIYGPKTADAVKKFQEYRGISSQMSANGQPILGSTTMMYLRESYSYIPQIRAAPTSEISQIKAAPTSGISPVLKTTKDVVDTTINVVSKIEDFDKPVTSMAQLIDEANKTIQQQVSNLKHRIRKLPKKTRLRHLIPALEKASKFISKAQKYGVNEAAKITYGSLTKQDIIKYLHAAADAIADSKITAMYKQAGVILGKIKNALSPLVKLFKKIPFLKYLGVIEKWGVACREVFEGRPESAFNYFVDGLRELLVAAGVTAAVGALVGMGWFAILLAVVLMIIVMIIEYFFFSDNPGESWVDEHTNLKTRNITHEYIAPKMYNATFAAK